jgi:hypothetical protein
MGMFDRQGIPGDLEISAADQPSLIRVLLFT